MLPVPTVGSLQSEMFQELKFATIPSRIALAYVFGNTALSRFARRVSRLAQPRVDLGQIGSGFSEVVSLSALRAFLLRDAAGQESALLVITKQSMHRCAR